MKRGTSLTKPEAEALAIQALTFIAADGERLGRFLAVTGTGPAEIRAASSAPGFLVGVLEYLSGDERLLMNFAADAQLDPSNIGKALSMLGAGGRDRERA